MSSAPHSAAPSLVDRVDHVDAFAVALPSGAPLDPSAWVDEIFSIDDLPEWVGWLFTLRSALVPILGLPAKPAENPFRVREVRDGEALVLAKDRHLDFAFGLRCDQGRMVATTVVHLHGWRGRVYWLPVSRFHGPVLAAMMRRAVERAG